MAINKNFVIKNGVEVNSSLIVGDSTLNKVGIATTVPGYTLHVGMDNGRGGIGATDLTVTGITTLGVGASASGALQVTGISTFDGLIDANGGISARTAAVQDLTADRVVLAGTGGELEDSGDLTFDGDKLSVGIATIWDSTGNVAIAGILTVGGSSITMGGTSIVDSNFQLKNIDSLDATTIATIESAIVAGPNIFDDLEITGLSTFVGFSTFESGFRVSGVGTFENDVDFYKSGFTTSVTWDQSENALTFTDAAAIRVGTGSDLAIFHDGSNSYIRESGTGALIIKAANFVVEDVAGNDYLYAIDGGTTALLYDGTKTFETSPQGIIVSGVTTSNRVYAVSYTHLTLPTILLV